MQRWEYLELEADGEYKNWSDSSGRQGKLDYRRGLTLMQVANELGEQGWELVNISITNQAYIFKRPK